MTNNITNKYFNDIALENFDYFERFPERRRKCIVTDKSYDVYDKREHFCEIYDAGKLNSFIKVVNDKLYLATSWANIEETYVAEMNKCISFRKSALELNRELFRTIFHRGNFFNIEIFKQIIRLGIRNTGIDKIIFKRMPYKFTVDEYKNYLSGIHSDYEIFEYAKAYTVVISCHGKTICVAMWDHSLPYF